MGSPGLSHGLCRWISHGRQTRHRTTGGGAATANQCRRELPVDELAYWHRRPKTFQCRLSLPAPQTMRRCARHMDSSGRLMDANSFTVETARQAIAEKRVTASGLVEQFY